MDSTRTFNYCLRNVTPEARARLRQSPHHVIEDFCLQRCGDCEQGPFLVVDGALVAGCNHLTLLDDLDRYACIPTSKGQSS
jgi:uncharacterized protein YuzB (UPF0349 family)